MRKGMNEQACPETFIEVKPEEFCREIVLDFQTMETGLATISLKPFAIGRYPVTNGQFHRFLQATHYKPQNGDAVTSELFLACWEPGAGLPQDLWFHPVTFVSYDDSVAYARWANGRLPTYKEWLYAACAPTNHKFPWGDTFSPDRCNVRESEQGGTTPVGYYSPQGDSPIGCADMMGNVWEWTATTLGDGEEFFVAMGPGWDHHSFQTEIVLDRSYRNHSVGFRVAKDLVDPGFFTAEIAEHAEPDRIGPSLMKTQKKPFRTPTGRGREAS